MDIKNLIVATDGKLINKNSQTKKLFLSSYFAGVAKIFPDFARQDLLGKKVCYIPTASIVEKVDFFVKTSKKALTNLGLEIMDLEISTAKPQEIKEKISSADMIFLEGGNTFFLLQELKRTGADKLIKKQVAKGKIYIGASAGSMVAGKNIEYAKLMDSPKKAPNIGDDFSALGLVDFAIVPHFANFPFKDAARKIVVQYDDKLDLKPISNHQTVTVVGGKVKIVEIEKKTKK